MLKKTHQEELSNLNFEAKKIPLIKELFIKNGGTNEGFSRFIQENRNEFNSVEESQFNELIRKKREDVNNAIFFPKLEVNIGEKIKQNLGPQKKEEYYQNTIYRK